MRLLSTHCGPNYWEAQWIYAAHPTVVMLKHDTVAFVEQSVPWPAGTRSARLRPGLGGHAWNADQGPRGGVRGGRECLGLNGEIEECRA